ncbi:MAG TPA: mercuric transporter MerT family protein [Gemmatimonadales bacterium]|jgi:mercuric ion transport protein|nr:mercuric transporter MerT family protein [Gemmatimonadales bacterium]
MTRNSRVSWSELGALTSAGTVAATILCCVPFATGVLGASVAAFGARFEPFRPYLVGVSLAMLGYAFYQAYRSDPPCADDECHVQSTTRIRRGLLWIVTALIVVFLTAPWWANWVIYWSL